MNGPEAALAEGSAWARAASADDLAELVQMYRSAREELAAMRGGTLLVGLGGRDGDLAASFEAELSDPGHFVAVAFSAPAGLGPAGYGTCTVLPLLGGGLLGSIDELYVKPDQRRRGVGRALATSLVAWCRAKGAGSIDAKALPGSRAVKSFFEGEGFTARLLVMHRRLVEPTGL